MEKHKYWGTIEEDWAGFSTEYTFTIPYFEQAETEVFLGRESDEDEEETVPPTSEQLDEYEIIFKNFISDIDTCIKEIQQKAFERYLKIYASYYEKPFTVEGFFETDLEEGSKHPPLDINSKEKHFQYMKAINYLRILDNGIILIPIHYALDTEHGLEIKLSHNKVEKAGGIGEA